jgi:competence protein ComEA
MLETSLRFLFLTGLLAAALAVVPAAPARAAEAKAAPAAAAKPAASGLVDLNTADEEQLTTVPGIGPALARRIVEFRKQNGGFKSVEDLLKVKGIGEKSFQKLRPHVTAGKK